MTTTVLVDSTQYRVVLIDPSSCRVCALQIDNRYRLISVVVHQNMRPAQQLQNALRVEWGVAALILDILITENRTSACAVAELLDQRVPNSLMAIRQDQLECDELSRQERASLEAILNGDTDCPFARLAWIDEAIEWLESSTGKTMSAKAAAEQYNASGFFTLIRFRMDDGCRFWLKATGAPHQHEGRVTSLLSKLCPGSVPDVIAERPAWNAWLMRDEGESISSLQTQTFESTRLLETAVKSLAKLQLRAAEESPSLLEAGAADHRASRLVAGAEALFAYVGEAMDSQTSTKVSRVESARIRELQNIFEDVCCFMDGLAIGDTILHGDMNVGNILFAERRCIFIDWAEGYVGNPLITFEHLLLLNSLRDRSMKLAYDQSLRDEYKSAMSKTHDPKVIEQGFAAMPLIAAASAILGRGDWIRTPLRNDPRRQGYVRAVARHMDRVAREPNLLAMLSAR